MEFIIHLFEWQNNDEQVIAKSNSHYYYATFALKSFSSLIFKRWRSFFPYSLLWQKNTFIFPNFLISSSFKFRFRLTSPTNYTGPYVKALLTMSLEAYLSFIRYRLPVKAWDTSSNLISSFPYNNLVIRWSYVSSGELNNKRNLSSVLISNF